MKKKNKETKVHKYPNEFYFDDYPICQEMKKAYESGKGLSSAEAKRLFEKAKEENKDDLYYDAMECLGEGKRGVKKAEKLLFDALRIDEHYVQTYIGLAQVFGISGEKKKAREAIIKAYEETLRKFPKWPREMPWGFLENRAYLRALQYRADLFWDDGKSDDAIKLFRLLLKLNPNDNQGVRYEISALYSGVSGDKLNKMFDEGNEKQDWSKLQKLVEVQNLKHHFWKEPKYD